MTKAEVELSVIQDLYARQCEIWNVLDGRMRTREERSHARKHVRSFRDLLRKADWRYMGGKDVWDALDQLSREAWRISKTA